MAAVHLGAGCSRQCRLGAWGWAWHEGCVCLTLAPVPGTGSRHMWGFNKICCEPRPKQAKWERPSPQENSWVWHIARVSCSKYLFSPASHRWLCVYAGGRGEENGTCQLPHFWRSSPAYSNIFINRFVSCLLSVLCKALFFVVVLVAFP